MNESDASPTTSLKALPVKGGFRLRGMEMTRLETFADAAFAFAVTLLVVGGGDFIPATFDEMIQAMKQVPAFAASFANIMLFWYAHCENPQAQQAARETDTEVHKGQGKIEAQIRSGCHEQQAQQ